MPPGQGLVNMIKLLSRFANLSDAPWRRLARSARCLVEVQ